MVLEETQPVRIRGEVEKPSSGGLTGITEAQRFF